MNKHGYYVYQDATDIMGALNDIAVTRASLIMEMCCDGQISVGEARRECRKVMGPAFDTNIPVVKNCEMLEAIESLPAPSMCYDVPFQVIDGSLVIPTAPSLAVARLSRLDPDEAAVRRIVGGPPNRATEESEEDREVRRQHERLWTTEAVTKAIE